MDFIADLQVLYFIFYSNDLFPHWIIYYFSCATMITNINLKFVESSDYLRLSSAFCSMFFLCLY